MFNSENLPLERYVQITNSYVRKKSSLLGGLLFLVNQIYILSFDWLEKSRHL